MSRASRFFINNLPDFQGGDVKVDKSYLKARAVDCIKLITQNLKKNKENCDGGLYVGIPGVAYMLHRLALNPEFAQEKDFLLDEANAYLQTSLEYAYQTKKRGHLVDKAAFILGNSGIFAIGTVIYKSLGNEAESAKLLEEFSSIAPLLLPVNWLQCGGDELLVGRAGYLSGVIWLQSQLKCQILNENVLDGLLDAMIESGKHYSETHRSPMPLMYQYYETEYLGAAHGLAGILQMLLSFPSWLSHRPEACALIKRSIEVLLSYQTASGNFPCAMDELGGRRPPEDELVHWCHGAPGTIYLFGKAYQVFGGEMHLQSAIKCGEITWKKGLLKKGPGICHGVAGSGYVFLTLYRLTGNPLHLHRALQFMSFLFTAEFKSARTPDCPYSLYEGLAGTVCFLTDLMNPEKSEFPFFNIF